VVLLVTGELAEDVFVPLFFSAMGVVALTYNALRLPRWALEREEQMDYIAGRVRSLISTEPEAADITEHVPRPPST
jgi:hypothetical protein